MISYDDKQLLRVGDVLYSVESYLMGNTTIRHRSVYRTVITRIEQTPHGVAVFGKWNGNTEDRVDLSKMHLHHPKPQRRPFDLDEAGYNDDVAHAAKKAAASRADWRERRKAAKAKP
jgi:hypothetical protein